MKRIGLAGLFIIALSGVGFYWYHGATTPSGPAQYVPTKDSTATESAEPDTDDQTSKLAAAPRVDTIGKNLTVPWEVLFLPDGELLVTERPGVVVLLKRGTQIPVPGVEHVGEGGLLGAALHPNFVENNWLYLYQTTETETGLSNRVVRYELVDDQLTLDRVIYDNIPGARYHDGGRIAFGPDEHLYITTGDAGDEAAAQDKENVAGSILRVTAAGEVPEDNPFGNAVYSYGHRNPQGLAWDDTDQLWSTEHGRSGFASGFDELNLIEAGQNYGWPDSQGDTVAAGTRAPALHSGSDITWAPASAAYLNGSIYFAGLRGETLYQAVLDGAEVTELREHVVGEYGRLRTVTVGPDGFLYVTTSNRDGRGAPERNDDRLLRVNPSKL